MSERGHVPLMAISAICLLFCLSSSLPVAAARVSAPAAATACARPLSPSGTVTIGDWEFPQSLNPYVDESLPAENLRQLLFQPLFAYDDHYRIVPLLAARVPTVANGDISGGGRQVAVHLRSGQRWSNGTEITAADLRFGWKVDRASGIAGACSAGCSLITSIATPDRYTAVLHLSHAYGPLLPAELPHLWPRAWRGGWAVRDVRGAAKVLANGTVSFQDRSVPTDGPYQVVDFRAGDHITFRAMPYFRGESCGTHIRTVRYVGLSLTDAAHLETPTTDFPQIVPTALSWTPAELARLKSEGYVASVLPDSSLEHLELNHDPMFNGKPNPLANREVRLALALAVDKDALIRAAYPTLAPSARPRAANSFLLDLPDYRLPFSGKEITGQWDPIARRYVTPGSAQAVSDARTLLASTPYASGLDLEGYTIAGQDNRAREMETLQADWAAIGVALEPEYVSPEDLYGPGGDVWNGDFQVALFTINYGNDPNEYRYGLTSTYDTRTLPAGSPEADIAGNFAAIQNPTIDRAFKRGGDSLDPSARTSAYQTAQRQVNRNADWIPLYFRVGGAIHRSRLHHFSPQLWTVPQWTLASTG